METLEMTCQRNPTWAAQQIERLEAQIRKMAERANHDHIEPERAAREMVERWMRTPDPWPLMLDDIRARDEAMWNAAVEACAMKAEDSLRAEVDRLRGALEVISVRIPSTGPLHADTVSAIDDIVQAALATPSKT